MRLRDAEREVRINLAYQISRRLVAKRQAKSAGRGGKAQSWDAYGESRHEGLRTQLQSTFGLETAKGKVILDFGCGDGALATTLMDCGAAAVHGVDVSDDVLRRFAERLTRYAGETAPTFSRNSSATRIDLSDQSFDAIYCFDVLEHVMAYREIIGEWRRVLKPGGIVYISWQPYWHPFGHHAHDWVPIPWAHAFLDIRELNEVCARVVDWDGFSAPIWDRDDSGVKKNRFRAANTGDGFLNKLTVHEFERIVEEVGFLVRHRKFQPFSGPTPVRAISLLMTHIPKARDFFTAFALYELVAT